MTTPETPLQVNLEPNDTWVTPIVTETFLDVTDSETYLIEYFH